jgi:hypothetical protein
MKRDGNGISRGKLSSGPSMFLPHAPRMTTLVTETLILLKPGELP